MKRIYKTIAVITLSVLIIFSALSCGGGGAITQEEYDVLKGQLDNAEARLAEANSEIAALEAAEPPPAPDTKPLEDEIASLKAELEDLGDEISALNEQNEALTQDKANLEAQYAALDTEYDTLEATLAELTQPVTFTTIEVEDEIFRLLNEERVKAGKDEFIKGSAMYNVAKQNSRTMAESGRVVTSGLVLYEETFWAIHYDSVAEIAAAALFTWKANEYRFEHGALLTSNKYGAVGAYESGDVFYITFTAAATP